MIAEHVWHWLFISACMSIYIQRYRGGREEEREEDSVVLGDYCAEFQVIHSPSLSLAGKTNICWQKYCKCCERKTMLISLKCSRSLRSFSPQSTVNFRNSSLISGISQGVHSFLSCVVQSTLLMGWCLLWLISRALHCRSYVRWCTFIKTNTS